MCVHYPKQSLSGSRDLFSDVNLCVEKPFKLLITPQIIDQGSNCSYILRVAEITGTARVSNINYDTALWAVHALCAVPALSMCSCSSSMDSVVSRHSEGFLFEGNAK